MKKPSYLQSYWLERLFTGGPELPGRIRPVVLKGLERRGFVEHCGVNGVLTIRLSWEGLYFMGASHAECNADASYWRAKASGKVRRVRQTQTAPARPVAVSRLHSDAVARPCY